MPVVQVERQLSTEDLLKAAGQLSQSELEQFTYRVITLRAQHQAPSLPRAEARLLRKINQGIPVTIQNRYDELTAKRRDETLSSDEYEELLRLTDQIEEIEARRLGYLAELARLRRTTLADLMGTLGIRPPTYV